VPNVTITQLPAAGPILGTEAVPIVQDGQTRQTTTAAIAASPAQFQTFLTLNQESTLPNSRRLTAGTGLGLTDGGALSTLALSLNGASGSLEAASTGIVVKTGSVTVAPRTLTASGLGLSITNGSGVAGNPTFALTGLVAGLANLSGPGLVSSDGSGLNPRVLLGTVGEIDVTNGTGALANPTVGLADDPIIPGTGGMKLPTGTTAERNPNTNGYVRYNTDLGAFEGYAGGSWVQFSAVSATVSSFSGGPTGLTPASATTGNIVLGGVLAVDHGGTGQTAFDDGELLIGSTAGNTLVKSTLTAGSGISITNGGGSITIAATSVGTVTSVSGTGSVNGITLTGTVTSSGNLTLGGSLTGVDLASQVTGTLPIANGGTGQSTKTTAFDALAPSTTKGDIIVYDGTDNVRLPVGTNGHYLVADSATASGVKWAAAASGGVTSVTASAPLASSGGSTPDISLTGTVAVANGGTGLTAGTSGGVLYYSATNTLASSAALAANSLVIGGGAGVAPSTITTGVGVVTALGVNTGSAGAFVVNGGALGTPSSGTLTNVSGLPLSTGVTGTLAVTNGGTGQTSYTDGQLLIGNTATGGLSKATLTQGSGVTITNGNGTITIAATGSGGTVTSVDQTFTGGLISVSGAPITGSGTLALTVAGTSGGIPYFSSGSTWASSAALSANALVVGGGAGVAPSTITTGTGVVNALGVNTGTAGAFVVNGGALGTPSSGTMTNVTGLPLSTGVTGTLPVANGGTGQTTYADGELLIGNSTGGTLNKATLTQGTGITITNGAGAITVSNASPMTYPSAGIPNSTGSAWGTSYSVTGTGTVVALATSPSFTTPSLGVATATSINKVAITAPASSATLTIADGKTLTANNSLTFSGTDGTTFTLPANSGTVVTLTETQTLTNKRVTARVSSTASISSPLAWNSDNYDQYAATAQAGALTINADAGTPTDGQRIIFRFKDDGTARALTWTTGVSNGFLAVGVTLPTTTTANKVTYVGAIYNASSSRWDVVAVTTEA
jgi:hypothetical protein